MKKRYVAVAVILVALFASYPVFSLFFKSEKEEKGHRTMKIYCADSLISPMKNVASSFENVCSFVDVLVEGYGSLEVIRYVTEMEDEVDLLMVTDYSLIPTMMYNNSMTTENHADWYICFTGNSIVLAYANDSRYSNEISAQNWYDILSRSDVRIGFSDPLIDALGYRTLMVVQLAENYYQDDQIFDDLIAQKLDSRLASENKNNVTVVHVPEHLNPNGDNIALGGNTTQLLSFLESGSIDYCFMYKSNAEQHNVSYIELPGQINLGSSAYEEMYKEVQIEFEPQIFDGGNLTICGKPIYYGLTIPNNAPNPDSAVAVVKYILSGEGKTIFDEMQQNIYVPAFSENTTLLPQELAGLVEKGEEPYKGSTGNS